METRRRNPTLLIALTLLFVLPKQILADPSLNGHLMLEDAQSERLWSDARIEALVNELIAAAKKQVSPDAELQGVDFAGPVRDFAERYGFSPDEVQARLERWAGEERDDLYRQGLAAMARKELGKAEGLFAKSAETATQQLESAEPDGASDLSRLREQAVRGFRLAGDTAHADYRFSAARDHYRAALSLLERSARPELSASILHSLAAANFELGVRAGDTDAPVHLIETVDALKGALALQTLEATPRQWAQTQAMLLRVYEDLGDAAGMATAVGGLLRAEPDNRDYYKLAHALNHEVLFDFEQAHSLTVAWLELYPDDMDALCNLAETHFTTGRFEPAGEHLEVLIESGQLPPELEVAMRLVEISNLLAMGKPDDVPERLEKLRGLVGDQPDDFAVGWAFEGSSHFIGQHLALADRRGILFGLLWAAETGKRDGLLAAIDKAGSELSLNR